MQPFILPEDTVLDIGCGVMTPTDGLVCKSILGVDKFERYLHEVKAKHPTIMLDVNNLDVFVDDSYDVVIALDVIEHLEKDDAIKLLANIKRIARKQAFIFTPKEFHTNEENTKNVWDMGDNELQRHRCLITKPELAVEGFARVKTACYPDMVLARWENV